MKNSLDSHLKNMLEKSKAMTDEEFQTMVKSVLVELEAKDKNLNEENARFWRTEIANHRYMFDRNIRKIESIKEITKNEWQQAFEDLFFTKRRRVDFRYNSHSHK